MNGTSFFFTLSKDATQDQIDAALSIMEPYGTIVPLSDIISRSEIALKEYYQKYVPMPLFLIFASFFSYFSTLMLVFKKKEQNLAIYHLCGGSRKECISTIMITFSIIALIPSSISTFIVLCIPYLDWIGMIDLSGTL